MGENFKSLNSIKEERLQSSWEELLEEIPENTKPPVVIFKAEGMMNLAQIGFGLSKSKEVIVPHLKTAAQLMVQAMVKMDPDDHDGASPFYHEYQLGLIASYGDESARKLCAEIQDEAFGPDDGDHKKKKNYLDYVRVLKRYVASPESVSQKQIQEIADRCSKSKGLKEDQAHALPAAQFLLALNDGDEKEMCENLEVILDYHKSIAKKGELRLLNEGLISFAGTGLYMLAVQRGFKLKLSSKAASEYLCVFE